MVDISGRTERTGVLTTALVEGTQIPDLGIGTVGRKRDEDTWADLCAARPYNSGPLNREGLRARWRNGAKVARTLGQAEDAGALRRLAAAGYTAVAPGPNTDTGLGSYRCSKTLWMLSSSGLYGR